MNKVKDERRKTLLSDDMTKEISIMDRKGLGEVMMLAENVMKNRTTVCMNAVNAFMDKKENMSREKVSDYRAIELLKKWQEIYPQSDETTKIAFESYQKILEKVRASEGPERSTSKQRRGEAVKRFAMWPVYLKSGLSCNGLTQHCGSNQGTCFSL